MFKNLFILGLLVVVVALPFVLRQSDDVRAGGEDVLVLTIVTPHNEAIRYEFEHGFSKWYQQKYGKAVRIDWRNVGGTTQILRYLSSEYSAATKAYYRSNNRPWPAGATDAATDPKFPLDAPPPGQDEGRWRQQKQVVQTLAATDNPNQIGIGIDLFFGGGQYDHSDAANRRLTVPAWPPGKEPAGLFTTASGAVLIPAKLSGEIWRTDTLYGDAVSTFGICYNLDRLADLGIKEPPLDWAAMADYRYFHQVGVADPTKSGSVAKAFEMIIHQQVHDTVAATIYSNRQTKDAPPRAGADVDAMIAANEARIAAYAKDKGKSYQQGDVPDDLKDYQAAVELGWLNGVRLVQSIGANARYFTDSATKVPIDVSVGDAAVGMAIDFYGRFQAQSSIGPDGLPHMVYVTPVGGSSVSCDPISLLRGAPHRELAERFIEYTLDEAGQQLWTYRPGTPGGPENYALRRLPIRRDFYPSTNPAFQARHEAHAQYAADPLADASVDPYQLAEKFTYYPRWTARLFGIQRDLIRAMCMNSDQELQAAWQAIHEIDMNTPGGPQKRAQAQQRLHTLPTIRLPNKITGQTDTIPLTWRTAFTINDRTYDKLDYMREWTIAFRRAYDAAGVIADK